MSENKVENKTEELENKTETTETTEEVTVVKEKWYKRISKKAVAITIGAVTVIGASAVLVIKLLGNKDDDETETTDITTEE